MNLWTDPWIDCLDKEGAQQRKGLRDVLLHVHQLREVWDHSPLVEVGIHRLLAAIAQDIVRPQEGGDLVRLWQAGRFDERVVEQFDERHAARFELFSDHPFMQSVEAEDNIKSVGEMKRLERRSSISRTSFPHAWGWSGS